MNLSRAARHPAPVIGLSAIIVAVTDERPRILVVRRMTHALATPAQKGHPADSMDSPDALPFGPLDADSHRTLERGLRLWVEEQTGLPLRYVEQLYTFGDRFRDSRELSGGPRVITVGYLALVRQARLSGSGDAQWRDWYGFLPWEDWREGCPEIVKDVIHPNLGEWITAGINDQERAQRQERVSLTFGRGDSAWDFERVLERYELLYEAGLVIEALREKHVPSPTGDSIADAALSNARRLGAPMALDNRRIIASALGRMRGKLKYRPVVFDLLPPNFTLLQLQRVVEALAGVKLHKQNFRRLVINGGLVETTGNLLKQTGGRPAKLFQFRRDVLHERMAPGVGLPAIRPRDELVFRSS